MRRPATHPFARPWWPPRDWPPAAGRRLLFGIGTGRNGSLSLATLLDAQPQTSVSHEFARLRADGRRRLRFQEPLPWQPAWRRARHALARILRYPGRRAGDVASWWLPYLPELLSRYDDVRVICLVRDRNEVVDSFVRKAGRRNHWQSHDGRRWEHDRRWDRTFPKLEAAGRAAAIGAYWDLYRDGVERLRERFPAAVGVWPMGSALNTDAGVAALLDFAGIASAEQVRPADLHRNRLSPRAGAAPPGSTG